MFRVTILRAPRTRETRKLVQLIYFVTIYLDTQSHHTILFILIYFICSAESNELTICKSVKNTPKERFCWKI